MSLYNTMSRAASEAEQLKSDKQLLTATKEAQLKETIQTAIREELKTKSLEVLQGEDQRERVTLNALDQARDLIANQKEYDYYYYKLQEQYDRELNRLEKLQAKNKKNTIERKKQIDILQETRREQIEYYILQAFKVLGIIIIAPFVLLAFIIIEVLKNTK